MISKEEKMGRVYCKKCNMLRNFYPIRENDNYKGKILHYQGHVCGHKYSVQEYEKYNIIVKFFLKDGTELFFPKLPKGNIKLIKR